ncbi:MAG: DMT family transporter, partial [Pseudomonadota bacterium]
IFAGIFFALDLALWHWALTLTTVANATFIVNLGNITVGLAAWIFLRERLTPQWAIAVVIALVGAACLTLGGGEGGKADLRGDALAFGAAILVAGYMLCAKIARRDIGALDVLFWITVTEAVVAGGVTFISGEAFFPAEPAGWRAPLALGLVVHAGGQGLIIAGLGRTPAAIAGILVLVQPVMAAAVSWQIFDEPLLAIQLLGGALLLFGVMLSQIGPPPKKGS